MRVSRVYSRVNVLDVRTTLNRVSCVCTPVLSTRHTNNKTKFLTVRRTPHATLVLAKLMPNGMNFTGDKSRCFWRPSAQDVRSRS